MCSYCSSGSGQSTYSDSTRVCVVGRVSSGRSRSNEEAYWLVYLHAAWWSRWYSISRRKIVLDTDGMWDSQSTLELMEVYVHYRVRFYNTTGHGYTTVSQIRRFFRLHAKNRSSAIVHRGKNQLQ